MEPARHFLQELPTLFPRVNREQKARLHSEIKNT